MQKSRHNLFFIFFIFIFIFIKFAFSINQFNVNITASVNPVCGNNILEIGEYCDGSNLGGQTCIKLGYGGGNLLCKNNCIFDTSNCVPPPSFPAGGGGGGWGSNVAIFLETKVIFSGKAYPKSEVTLLKDAQVVATVRADDNANFNIVLSDISGGNYIFSLYSEDSNGERSSLVTFPVSITRGATVNISNIFIPPTIDIDKLEVKKGDIITVFGQTSKNTEVVIYISSENELFLKTKTDNNGFYLYKIETYDLEIGQHFVKSRAVLNENISSFSKTLDFKVGTKNILKEKKQNFKKGDLNKDGKVNLIDFSILAYWYKRQNFPINLDLNNDGKINLIDFSILAYYWTG